MENCWTDGLPTRDLLRRTRSTAGLRTLLSSLSLAQLLDVLLFSGRAAAALIAMALVSILTACAAPKPAGPVLLHPLPPAAANYALVEGAIVFSGPEFTVSARPWDYRLVEQEFTRTGEPCPFGATPADAAGFLFIRLRLENRSARTLVFNSLRASLLRPDEAPLVPLENSDLFVFAGENNAEAEARSRIFRRECFDGSAVVRPAQSLERFLAFRAPAEKVKVLTLTLDELWLGAESFNLRFDFEAFPVQ